MINKKECINCLKIFTAYKSSKNDGLCGKCRSRLKFIKNIDKYRKTNTCPNCKKKILKTSKFCSSCGQLGNRNPNYKNGEKSLNRYCVKCNNKISTASKGLCFNCYIKSIPRGKDNFHYIDGRSFNNLFKSDEYLNWKISVINNDNFTCQLCKYYNKRRIGLHAHHILPRRLFSKFIFEISNGITLCKECHKLTYGKELSYINLFLLIKNRPYKNSVNSVNGEIPNTEPSNIFNIEGVTTRDEIKFPTSAGQPYINIREDIV